METRKTQLRPDSYYHIYNRGINWQNIFLEDKNYAYFLQKYAQYISPYFDTYAYCLLKNHFHILVQAKSENDIRLYLNGKHKEKSITWILSNAFSSLFKSYAQAINKQYLRTGGFFEEPFHRIEVTADAYFSQLVYYIHTNPQKHGFVVDFKDYKHSSYHSHLLSKTTKLKKENVLEWFGGKESYIEFHNRNQDMGDIKNLIVEFQNPILSMRLKSMPAKPMPSLQAKASVNYEILGLKDMCKISWTICYQNDKMVTSFMLLLWMNNKP